MLLLEVHIALLLHRNDVDMSVRNFETHDGNTYLDTWDSSLDSCSHTLGKEHVSSEELIVLIKDIVDLLLRDDQGMTFGYRIDIKERIELIVLCDFVAWNLTSYDS